MEIDPKIAGMVIVLIVLGFAGTVSMRTTNVVRRTYTETLGRGSRLKPSKSKKSDVSTGNLLVAVCFFIITAVILYVWNKTGEFGIKDQIEKNRIENARR